MVIIWVLKIFCRAAAREHEQRGCDGAQAWPRGATQPLRVGWWPRRGTPRLREGAAAALCCSRCKERPHVHRTNNPNKQVGTARGDQSVDILKLQSQTISQSDHRTTVMCNSMKLSHAVWGHPRQTGHGGEVCQNVVHWRREWQTTSEFLP